MIIVNNYLIKVKGYTENSIDDRGFDVEGEVFEASLFASVRSAGIIEHYESMKAGIKITYIFNVDTDSFNATFKDGVRPSEVEYDGMVLKIHNIRKRTNNHVEIYKETELVCVEME